MRTHGRSILAALLLLASVSLSASVQKIGPDLYAYISDNDSSANATFLVTSQGVLVVDAGLNAAEGKKLLAEIRKLSPVPVRYLVNTHYHADHTGGDAVVGNDAIFFSTEFTRTRISGKKALPHIPASAWITFPHSVTLYLGGHQVEIYHPGPAHTLGDVVVYFPDEHAIATGDLFLTNSCPAMDDGDLENWIKALDQILALPVEHVVPGHFELATKKEVQRFRNYLETVRSQVSRMYRSGFSREQVKQQLALQPYRDFRQFPKYEATFADNAATYYEQLERPAHDKVKKQRRQQQFIGGGPRKEH